MSPVLLQRQFDPFQVCVLHLDHVIISAELCKITSALKVTKCYLSDTQFSKDDSGFKREEEQGERVA